ncbi:hypothetical protein ATKI12_5796 [Kitasatospora sp. Ki12]
MRNLILGTLLRVCRFLLTPSGRHPATRGTIAPNPAPSPMRANCAQNRPVPAHLLALTIPLTPPRLIPPYLAAWEALPDETKEAQRQANVRTAWPRWEKVRHTELSRRLARPQRAEQPSVMAARRACAFAATLDLPDPVHYLDDATNADRELIGAVA